MSSSEAGYRCLGDGTPGLFWVSFNPSALPFRHGASSRPLQYQHLAQVVAHPLQPQVIEVAPPAEIATSLQAIAPLQGADDPLYRPAHSRVAKLSKNPL